MSLTDEEEELLEASLEKDVTKVKKLLDSGVSPNIKLSYNEYTPMHFAVHRPGSAELVQLLLAAGAAVDPLDKDLHSPLHDTKEPEVAELLLKAGAKVDRLTQDGETVYHRIANFHESNFRPPPEEDSAEEDDDEPDDEKKKKKVLLPAPTDGLNKLSIVQDNIVGRESEQDTGIDDPDPNPPDDGYSPKKHYIPSWDGESKQVECARLLIEAGEKCGLDINTKDKADMTALHVAALGGGSTMMKLFLRHGADANGGKPSQEEGPDGNSNNGNANTGTTNPVRTVITPLHRTAVPGYVECARVLIAAGADVNRADVHGDTPLHWAAQHGHRRLSKVLLRAGADPNKANQRGQTPAAVAKQHGHTKLTTILNK